MILDQIVDDKRRELEVTRRSVPLEIIQARAVSKTSPLDLALALDSDHIRLIAEVKKASPSRGVICQDFKPVEIARTYAENGAAAISVLTEKKYFQGSLSYLSCIDNNLPAPRLPLLRKDFIFDPYQVYESRAHGADAILLIVAILNPDRLQELLDLGHTLGLSCLVEAHSEEEVETAVKSGARIIGINNRDLKTFKVDLSITERLSPLIPGDRILVSESGIKTRADVKKLKGWGVKAVLVGETLLSSHDIKSRIRELL
jgi:indole-3-glycerol phosphate synthase